MIEPPQNCPSCNSVLVFIKDQLYCQNINCDAKSFKQIEHFAKTLKIKGLGPSSIEKLDINDILDIYSIDLNYITMQLGSERNAIKIFDEINKSKTQSLNTVLPAFGIPLVGKTASDKLAQVVESLFDIDEATCKAAGLGPKVTENLMNWLENEFDKYSALPFSFEFSKETRPLDNKGVVCITGKLNSYPTKAAAKAVLESLGYIVKDTLTKEVTILVNESGVETAKTKKAAESGVTMVINLKQYIGEYE